MIVGRLVLFVACTLVVVQAYDHVTAAEIPFYVGRKTCLECHQAEESETPCTVAQVEEHLQAHASLSKPEATHIAFLSGIPGKPEESRVCLGCHSTGADAGPRWARSSFRVEDGVQCEACHGAGSLHVEARRLSSVAEPSASLPALRGSEDKVCRTCHLDRRSHSEVLEGGYRRPPVLPAYKTPVNLAVSPSGDRLYVVCEGSDSVVVVDLRGNRRLDEIAVGRGPHDVAVQPDGSRLYVSNRLSNSVTVIDTANGKRIGEVAVGAEPHGLLTDPEGRRLFVLNTGQNSISVLETRELDETTRLAAGAGPWSMALHPDGESICVTSSRPDPAPFREEHQSELTLVVPGRARVRARPAVRGANMMQGVAFVPGENVALFTLQRTKNLVPMTRLAQGWVITNGLGVLWPDGRVDQVLLDLPAAAFADPNDVAVSPDGSRALVTSGGTDQVAVIDVPALLNRIGESSDHERAELLPNHLGTSDRYVIKRIPVGHNPRGVTFSPDGRFAYVANALSDTVTVLDTATFEKTAEITLDGPESVNEIRRGERIFHSAGITYAQQFSCHSCHPDGHTNGLTFDIEADGLGLALVDNRTLRGILDTAPFKWEGTNPSLQRQCGARLAVFFTRLDPYSSEELNALDRYIASIERPPNPNRDREGLTPAQRRGKMIFERTMTNEGESIETAYAGGSSVGRQACTACHRGPYGTTRVRTAVGTDMWFDTAGTDFSRFDLKDDDSLGRLGLVYYSQSPRELMELDVPHLNNIYNGAPYLHNGAATTLEEIWTRYNLYDWHGVTNDLTRAQFNDLIAYLKAF